jgi:hypothetical protein
MFKHTKTFKRDNGTRCRITVKFYTTFDNHISYLVDNVLYKKPKSTKWELANNSNYLDSPTNQEVYETKLELWNQLKPKGEKDV